MERLIDGIESLKKVLIESDEQDHVVIVYNNMAYVDNLRITKFLDIARVDMWAFVLCTSGSCRFSLNFTNYTMERGMVLIYQPSQVFKISHLSDDCGGKILFVGSEMIDESLARIADMFNFLLYVKENPCTTLTESQYNLLLSYEQIILLKKDNIFHKEISNNLLMALFFEVLNMYSHNILQYRTHKNNSDYIFERFLHSVSENHTRERSIKFYAQAIGISPKYLSQICFKVSGRHAGQWIDKIVVSRAKELLLGTDLTIQQISNELNFANQSFFGKYFRKHVGKSPREFRKSAGMA